MYFCVAFLTLSGKVAEVSSSSYEAKSLSAKVSKSFVGSLTALTNKFSSPAGTVGTYAYQKTSISPTELLDSLRGDFRRGYLFSGEIDCEIYDNDCVFTDPTLSFKGLNTFRSNIENLKPLISKFVGTSVVLLHDIKLNKDVKNVKARWTMYGRINLPWSPCIDLRGETTYTYDDTEKAGRIVDYYEKWELPAFEALAQLLQRGKKLDVDIPTSSYSVIIDETDSALSSFYNGRLDISLCSKRQLEKLKSAMTAKAVYDVVNTKEKKKEDNVVDIYVSTTPCIFGQFVLLKTRENTSLAALGNRWGFARL